MPSNSGVCGKFDKIAIASLIGIAVCPYFARVHCYADGIWHSIYKGSFFCSFCILPKPDRVVSTIKILDPLLPRKMQQNMAISRTLLLSNRSFVTDEYIVMSQPGKHTVFGTL